jgi:hypothetical protein
MRIKIIAGAVVALLLFAGCGTATPTTSGDVPETNSSTPVESPDVILAPDGQAGFDAYLELAENVTTAHFTSNTKSDVDGKEVVTDVEGDIDATDKANYKISMVTKSEGTEVETVIVGKAMYTKMNGEWTKADAPDMSSINSAELSDQMKANLKSSEYVGPGDVDGAPAQHYKFTVSGKMISAETPDFDYDVYIADDNKSLRMEASYEMKISDMNVKSNMVMVYTKIGDPVTIEVPKV